MPIARYITLKKPFPNSGTLKVSAFVVDEQARGNQAEKQAAQ
jgi:hypothetical protein